MPVTRRSFLQALPPSLAPCVLGGIAAAGSGGCSLRAPKSTQDARFQREFKGFRYCDVKAVKQSAQLSCGAAALTSVLNYWLEPDPPYEEPDLIARYPTESENGYPILQLREIAIAEGLAAFAVTMDEDPWKELTEHVDAGRPVIVAIECPRGRYFGKPVPVVGTLDRRTVLPTGNEWKSHYVVVMGRSYQEVLCMDPKYGIVRIDRDEFAYFWKRAKHAALICSTV